ncbi:hypothetical protein VRZ08_01030 [Rhodopseudomonas sp. G2_2311]|uniref:hypothetical protein n=1 Tax=Rhodopseudomonas sp. G2_2311 TaxID=3114287 RepID=UPI0039C63C95
MSKPVLCLDFDGVLHSYMSGWQGADVIPDPPVPGAWRFMKQAQEHFRVAVFSSRTSQPGGLAAMRVYVWRGLLEEFGRDALDVFELIEWPLEKPPALVSIDDRALTFDGSWPSVASLRRFQPWNKRKPIADDMAVTVDREAGTVEICGVRYEFDVFRFLGLGEVGRAYRLVGRRDGVVTLEFLDGDGADAVTCDVTVTQHAANLES